MKRLLVFILLLVLMAAALPALAQVNPDLITLDDATPAIDVVITLPPDTTGTIALDIAQAAVRLTDARNAMVFYAADARLHGVEFNIAPNTGTHTLTVERLPGATEAYVGVASLPEMTVNGTASLVEDTTLTFNQAVALSLDAATPAGAITIHMPTDTIGVVTATFPGVFASTQLVDSAGVVLAESTGGHVDGLTFVLDGGDYDFTVLGSGLTDTVVAGVRTVPVNESGIDVIAAPSTDVVTSENTGATCTAIVTASSASLRSGPGTGYSVLGYGYLGETFPVGGQNPESNWIVVGTPTGGAAWLATSVVQTQGACDGLTVFNIPLRDATPTEIIITSPGSATSYDDDEHEHEEHEEHEEHDDDDWGEHDD